MAGRHGNDLAELKPKIKDGFYKVNDFFATKSLGNLCERGLSMKPIVKCFSMPLIPYSKGNLIRYDRNGRVCPRRINSASEDKWNASHANNYY